MKGLTSAFLVVLAIYIFFAMVSSIDFSGMSFGDVKLILSVCLGVAVSVLSSTKGINIIVSAVNGFVAGAILYAFILWAIEHA